MPKYLENKWENERNAEQEIQFNKYMEASLSLNQKKEAAQKRKLKSWVSCLSELENVFMLCCFYDLFVLFSGPLFGKDLSHLMFLIEADLAAASMKGVELFVIDYIATIVSAQTIYHLIRKNHFSSGFYILLWIQFLLLSGFYIIDRSLYGSPFNIASYQNLLHIGSMIYFYANQKGLKLLYEQSKKPEETH
ncbi:MAG: hypothetical protein IJP07_00500 [Firmicutes bacterium]|nr:hypothetical protein [Bacillota bacterium]